MWVLKYIFLTSMSMWWKTLIWWTEVLIRTSEEESSMEGRETRKRVLLTLLQVTMRVHLLMDRLTRRVLATTRQHVRD